MHRLRGSVSILLACAGLALLSSSHSDRSAVAATSRRTATGPVAENAGALRRQMVAVMLDDTNRARSAKRKRPLSLSEDLSAAAQAHAEDMLARGYFSHDSPEGEAASGRVMRLAPRAIVLSVRENILSSQGHEDDAPHVRAALMIDGWMDSPGHRRNQLSEDVTDVGFGVASKLVRGRLHELSVQVLGRVVGSWTRVPPSPLRVPGRLRARLSVPVEFFLEDTAHPKRRYKDPEDATHLWIGGVPLVVLRDTGVSVLEVPKLDPGRYRLLGRLQRRDGYQAVREIRVVG